MVVLLHGAAGGLDELIIAVVALGVLWLAVKLAGRKPAAGDDEEPSETGAPVEVEDPAAPRR